jgi:hypothetical protein
VTPRLPLLAHTLASPCLGREPKTRVAIDLIPICLFDLMFIHLNCFQNFNELKIRVVD